MSQKYVDDLVAMLDAKMQAGVSHVNVQVDDEIAAAALNQEHTQDAQSALDVPGHIAHPSSDDSKIDAVCTEVDYSLVPLACAVPTSMCNDQE